MNERDLILKSTTRETPRIGEICLIFIRPYPDGHETEVTFRAAPARWTGDDWVGKGGRSALDKTKEFCAYYCEH